MLFPELLKDLICACGSSKMSRYEENLELCKKHLKPNMCYWAAVKIAMKFDFDFVDEWECIWDPACGCSTCAVRAGFNAGLGGLGTDLLTETVHEHCSGQDAQILADEMVQSAACNVQVADVKIEDEGQVLSDSLRNGMQEARAGTMSTSRKRRQRRNRLKHARAAC